MGNSRAAQRRQLILVIIIVILLATVALSQLAIGNFNAATGFSGRHGATCSSCHNAPDAGPAGDEPLYDEPAVVEVTGLPAEYDHEAVYVVNITVTGGPPPAPPPQAQGGFEIEASNGRFSAPDGMQEFIDVYAEDGRAVTYTVAGTQMRSWQVTWTAPGLDEKPSPVTFWLAAMSANGNHFIEGGQQDGGEFGDSVANVTIIVHPSESTEDAWQNLRLSPPQLGSKDIQVEAFQWFVVSGVHTDPAATAIGYRINNGEWEISPTGPEWRLEFQAGLGPGNHQLDFRSLAGQRASDNVALNVQVEDAPVGGVNTPAAAPILTIIILMAASARSRK